MGAALIWFSLPLGIRPASVAAPVLMLFFGFIIGVVVVDDEPTKQPPQKRHTIIPTWHI